MAIHRLETRQIIRATPRQCWAFFSDPRNLAEITPASLDFQVMTPDLPPDIHPGLMIEYRVRPLAGIPMTWLTEITRVEEGRCFIDEQRVGPYRIWHHEHWFRELGEGRMEIRDRLHYVLPFQWADFAFHAWLVRPQLAKIFAYRKRAVAAKFGP